jgi:hypothetical protein
LRSCQNDGRPRFHVLEFGQMTATDVAFISRDPADVVRKFSHDIVIEIVQRSAHIRGVFLIDAENDRFRKAIRLVQKISEMFRNGFRPLEQRNFPFKIRRSVNLIWNASPIAIKIIFARPPTRRVPLCNHAVDSIWSEEAVFDSLPQTVLVNWIPKIKICVAGLVAQRCGCHAELICGLEILKNLPPLGLFSRAPAMAFIDDD